jgi:isocitrate/isopropylmalate dehydrogenase
MMERALRRTGVEALAGSEGIVFGEFNFGQISARPMVRVWTIRNKLQLFLNLRGFFGEIKF